MLVVVTYDENGGFWDHAALPKGDRWGPGTRVPALIVSPFAKQRLRRQDAVRHRLDPALHHPALGAARRCPASPLRDAALRANGRPPMGDLTAALEAPR